MEPTEIKRNKRIRLAGVSDTKTVKQDIQDALRAGVIKRDGGCILRNVRWCGGDIGYAVLQADHLITRANSATYADLRLVVCVCRPCHAWKSLGSNARKKEYDTLVRKLLPADRVALWDACEADSWRPKRTGAYDWKMALIALKREVDALPDRDIQL